MRRVLSALSGALLLWAVSIPLATSSCSSGNAPASPDSGSGGTGGSGGSGATGGSGGTGGSAGGGDGGGGEAGGDASSPTSCGPGCYQALGCAYQVKPPEDDNRTLGYLHFSVDTSSPVGSVAGATPVRVRLGLGGATEEGKPGYADPTTSGVFTWETIEQDSNAKVKMGLSPTALTDVHTGYTWTMASPPTNFHEVHVCGLTPGTTYYYEVGGGAPGKEVWSATQSFTTIPSTGPIRIGAWGDARDSVSIWQIVNQRMKAQAVNLNVISGDIVIVGGVEEGPGSWQQWLDAIWSPQSEQEAGVGGGSSGFLTLGEQLIVPIAGNHEAESPDFYANWSIPGTGDYSETYASFNVGSAHIVMFDDEPLSVSTSPDPSSFSPEAAAQVAWLKSDLAAADNDRTAHPFIIVVSHRGVFSTSLHSADPDVLLIRAVLAPIYDTYHVDLVLNGHDHEYERSYPVNANPTDPSSNDAIIQTDSTKGTTYVINAGAGASAYAVDQENQPYRAKSWEFDYSTGYIGCYGILDIDGHTLTMTEYGIQGAATPDTMVDTFTLTR